MYTATDLTNVEEAIRAIIAGEREVSMTMDGKSATYTEANLKDLQNLRTDIINDIAINAGTCTLRTYAKQGGRGA
jgi:hypothetical protein